MAPLETRRIESDLSAQSVRLVVLGVVAGALAIGVGAVAIVDADYVTRFGVMPFFGLGALLAAIALIALVAGAAPAAVLVLDAPPRLGSVLEGTIELRVALPEGARATLALRGAAETQTIEPASITRDGARAQIRIRCAAPSRSTEDEWRLELRVGADVLAVFALPLDA